MSAETRFIEYDCPDCETTHVVDKRRIERMTRRRWFRCSQCGERKRTRQELGAVMLMDSGPEMICRLCELVGPNG
jgi:uncharacterized Zn finger protein